MWGNVYYIPNFHLNIVPQHNVELRYHLTFDSHIETIYWLDNKYKFTKGLENLYWMPIEDAPSHDNLKTLIVNTARIIKLGMDQGLNSEQANRLPAV